MDVPRGKEVARRRTLRRMAIIFAAIAVIGGTTVALARLKPAAPSVDMSGLWPGTVKRGPMERQGRGLGRPKPEEIYLVKAGGGSPGCSIFCRGGAGTGKGKD